MVVFGALIISLIISLVFYFKNPKEYKWWELLLTITIISGLIFGSKAITDNIGVMFTEYWGETIIEVYEEEPSNEWISQTCTEQYACGTDSDGNTTYCTRTYDCSYQDDTGPSWWANTDLGNQHQLSEHLYDSLINVYGRKLVKTKTHKNYAPRDRAISSNGTKFQGTKVGNYSYTYKCSWPGTDATRKGVFTKHRYENRIKASDLSLFNIPVVSKEEADSMGLYQYPAKVYDKYNFPTILCENVDPNIQAEFRKLNAKYGPSNRMRLWILVFEDKPAITATYQENYWVRGNLNELVVCIGKNGDEIEWSHAFSWGLNGTLTTEAASKVLDLYEYTVTSSEGQTLPIAIPIVNKQMKQTISDVTRIDTAMLPPVIPIPFARDKVVTSKKSKTPILNKRTWIAYYDYLNENLTRYEKRSHDEFSYIKVEPKTWMIVLIYILAITFSIGFNIYASSNEIHDK